MSLLKVFIPMPKSGNTFFQEIINFSSCTFDYGHFEADISNYNVVLIHWPELMFKWAEPNDDDLDRLEKQLKVWREYVKIVYVVHNERRHFGMSSKFEKLYALVQGYCHVMVHMGHYSLDKCKGLYPDKVHQYIPHPLYESSFVKYDKVYARKQLGIPITKQVVLAPGRIRNLKERDLIVKSFKALKIKEKHLLVPYMFKKKIPFKFKGSYRLQRVKFIRGVLDYFLNKEAIGSYQFGYNLVASDILSLMLSAADIIFIPRINALNSGVLFLGLTYRKMIIGPATGNIQEVLDQFEMPKFFPGDTDSVKRAMLDAFNLASAYSYDENDLADFLPKNVAKKWDSMLMSL